MFADVGGKKIPAKHAGEKSCMRRVLEKKSIWLSDARMLFYIVGFGLAQCWDCFGGCVVCVVL